MKSVFIAMGTTGEYSDRQEWPVVAYLDETSAKAKVMLLDEWLRERDFHMDDNPNVPFEARYNKQQKNPLDPQFKLAYTGTRYYYLQVPLEAPGI